MEGPSNGDWGTRNRWEVEEAFDVGDDDWGAMAADVGADPVGFGRACGDKGLGTAEAEALDGSDKPLLPAMVPSADGIVAALRHPTDIPAPKGRPPKAWLPGAVYPDFIRRPQPADASPSRERHLVPFFALLAHYQTGDVGRAVPALPPCTDVKNSHTANLNLMLAAHHSSDRFAAASLVDIFHFSHPAQM